MAHAAYTRRVVAVAFSGGRDSTALLHACARAAGELGIEVVALHVHHGLLAQADDWLTHAQATCRRWAAKGLPIRLLATRLTGRPQRGDSIEAWARRERYAALSAMAKQADAGLVLLAHHRRDQAETVLLQALRGAGPAGLAAMPRTTARDGLVWARPWLGQPREAIDAYLRRFRLRHVDDPSNADSRFARNRLRAQAWPALAAAFPDVEAALGLAAARAAEASAVLAEVADADLALCSDAGGLQVEAWSTLSAARRANALRLWLARACGRGAPESLVQRLQAELPGRRQGRWPLDGARECRLYRGALSLRATDAPALPTDAMPIDLSSPGAHRAAAWRGVWDVRAARRHGIALELLRDGELRPRTGGERFQASARSVARSLKKQYQALGVPPAQRAAPLLYARGRLLFVPGLGVDARAIAAAGEPQARLRWIADEPGR